MSTEGRHYPRPRRERQRSRSSIEETAKKKNFPNKGTWPVRRRSSRQPTTRVWTLSHSRRQHDTSKSISM